MIQNLLLVDDSRTTRAVMKKTLKMAGYLEATFFEANHGREALEVLRQHRIDVVFADLNMPEMTGDELILAMDADPALRDVPVIIASTEGSKTRIDQLKRPGVLGQIRKPFTPEQVRELLERLLEPAK